MGYIYVIHHSSFGENIYKIGRTENLKNRISQYNTGTPTEYAYKYTKFVGIRYNSITIEKAVHDILKKYRISKKEFFKINIETIINTIEDICLQLNCGEIVDIDNVDVELDKIKNVECDTLYLETLQHRHQNKKILCKMNQNVQNELNNRVNDLEDNVEQFQEKQCEFCNVMFSTTGSLYRHLKEGYCKSRYDCISVYEKQLGLKHNDNPPLTCRFCLYKFAMPQSFSRHKTKGCKAKISYLKTLEFQIAKLKNNIN